ncbi:MAG: hypothetical protein IAE97_06845 [Chthoniobacterales bacterium]|nr:hypothetical protein [Chthoniobacterales bacterium]
MAIYVYITENCRENAITYGLQHELERFTARVEKAQSLELFANFPPPYLVKRKFGGDQGRLIARHIRVPGAEEHTVVCFLAVLIRGSKDYDKGFGIDPIGWGDKHLKGLYTNSELEEWLLGRLDKSIPEPPPPSEIESRFLHAVTNAATGEDDWTVAEQKGWVHRVQQQDVVPHLGPLFDALNEVVKNARTGSQTQGIQPAGNSWAIRWSAYPNQKLLVLEDVVPAAERSIPRESQSEESRAEILQSCRRAYLDIVTADQSQWLAIQRDSEGNLALSPEEEEVIDSTRPGNSTAFPLFINGRAGSGKSTVLQYLFADYLMTYIELLDKEQLPNKAKISDNAPWPAQGAVYFTCSKDLLSKARTAVETILRNGAQYWDKSERKDLIARRRSDIDSAFRELRGYLLSLVPEQDRHRFDERNYVSFPRYQRLWTEKFGKDPSAIKQYGSALSWHVIRTHIKGASADDLLDPEEYELLERKQRTVSSADYRLIYDKVWDKWYRRKCEGEHLWDDQDLARYLLENDLALPVFHAIFCDESQDFTSVELQAILRLSIFSKRKLRSDEVSRVPFVFAGDPFQTLNPTGFRWESTKASYFKNFVLALNPWGDQDTSLNYKELSHNYRSSKSIVGLCNLIQAKRAHLFQMKTVKPQEIWSDEDAPLPVYWFRADDNAFWVEFANQKDLVVITPCPEGCEVQYVQDDPFLKSQISIKGDTPENVWSAIRSKGLEFDRVVLYGFGSVEEALRLNRLTASELQEDAASRLPAEYFFNQLYVAASRAKHALFVVDTSDGLKKFWPFAWSQSLDELLSWVPGGIEKWKEHVQQMVEGQVDILRTGQYDAARMAADLEKQGVAAENAFIMRQAAVHYRNAENHIAAEHCQTRALLFEEKFTEAARAFFKQKRWDEGVRAYWMDGVNGRRELGSVGATEPEVQGKLEWRMAEALDKKATDIGLWIDLLDDVVRNARKERAQWPPKQRKAWSDAVLSAISRVVAFKRESAPAGQWLEFLHRVGNLMEFSLCAVAPLDRGVILARAGQFQEARKVFNEAGLDEANLDGQPEEFLETLAECLPFPKNIGALDRLGKHARIIQEWESKPDVVQTSSDVALIANSLIRANRESDAMPLAVRTNRDDLTRKCAENFFKRGDIQATRRAMLCTLLMLGRSERLGDIIQITKCNVNGSDGSQTWETVLGDAFAPHLAKALAGGDAVADDRMGPKLVGMLKPEWAKVDASSKAEVHLWGAAVERTGQFNAAIEFYDGILSRCPIEASHEDLRQWIRGRSLKAKWKRTLRMDKGTAASERVGIKKESEKWKLESPEAMAELPDRVSFQKDLERLATASSQDEPKDEPAAEESMSTMPAEPAIGVLAAPAPDKIQLFGFDFHINRPRKRLTIMRPPSDDRVRVELGQKSEFSSDLSSEHDGYSKWTVPDWDIEVSLLADAQRPQAAVRLRSQCLELRFDIT